MMTCVRHIGDELVLFVRVHAGASSNEVVEVRNGRLLIRTTTAPSDGKANKTVIRLLASLLDVAPSRVRLVRGQTQRNKVLHVSGPVELPRSIFHEPRTNGL